LLGRGGFGRVYQCFNPLDNQFYAVKKIPLSPELSNLICTGQRPGGLGSGIEELLREVKALATLDHPNVVRYHQTWIEEPPVTWQGKSTLFTYMLDRTTNDRSPR
jgi:eukaryotic translation initiation factor 2-alpha kinase 3